MRPSQGQPKEYRFHCAGGESVREKNSRIYNRHTFWKYNKDIGEPKWIKRDYMFFHINIDNVLISGHSDVWIAQERAVKSSFRFS